MHVHTHTHIHTHPAGLGSKSENLPIMKYGNAHSNHGISTENTCFDDNNVLESVVCVDYRTLEPAVVPLDWGNKAWAASAARGECVCVCVCVCGGG